MDKSKLLKLYNQFNKVHNQFSAVKRQLVNINSEEHIYPAEMQILCLLQAHPTFNLSDISKELYMTKSAVSQTIKKLTIKGLAEKYRDPENERYNIIQLTPIGKLAVEKFFHNESYTFGELIKFMESRSDSDIVAIVDFLDQLETMFNKKLQ